MNQMAMSFVQTRARRSDTATSQAAGRNADKFASSHAGRILPELSKLGLAKVVKLDDGADMVRGGFRVWAAV